MCASLFPHTLVHLKDCRDWSPENGKGRPRRRSRSAWRFGGHFVVTGFLFGVSCVHVADAPTL